MSELLKIDSIDNNGRGVARRDGKAIFVEGAITNEIVEANIYQKKDSFEVAHTERILKESSSRVSPKCPNYGLCGGCSMQHIDPSTQVAVKQRTLEDNFKHIAKIKIPKVLPAIHGPYWNYRYRARLSVRYVRKKEDVLVGFREKKGRYVVDMHTCPVLAKPVSDLLPRLRACLKELDCKEEIPQIEVAVGEETVVLALRHMVPLSSSDFAKLKEFAHEHKIVWWSQAKGLDSLKTLDPLDSEKNNLYYDLPQFGLRMYYEPSDFTQVNPFINRTMIRRALDLLEVHQNDRVADLFCGLGNFTLPLSTIAKEVVGIEGSESLTKRAMQGAQNHGLQDKVKFSTLNLFEVDSTWLEGLGAFDKMLLDPPRDGAFAVCKALTAMNPSLRPKRIVYVSCNPSTLARDADVLVNSGAYKLLGAGVINMFPHTAHVESIAVFERT
ncbi:23S rRNA (uracil(1939)-C(5))-methyltransferase RlmD [Taylorella equigenitalis]|uniref:23S rRNA (uracil(1939)-C(5))-methyltransferase RlmD n=1 Tax=Taylorella equigenitalis TaxID=29575 RepID=UPI00041B4980|nr:23S rRNA (uracil(1939)-C(5))-methyltransferase RlmD [Taylorella equigenitalis]ASY30644.1 23S rRNA (uracil(1939)-C(5))-methyltransferase [Taylorella equigenitalis]ASY40938.1 23S rRNA (uracil(1939)-C(5))-methyltransferase [Taylorella equigenitalis]KOS58256.1 23S rRNA methyltransferase [Taylorella equigenitalis]